MMNYTACDFVTNFRGEMANNYDTHLEYVEMGAWEKDYFADWLASCSDYPSLEEIEDFCHSVNYYIGHWFDGVEAGIIDPEAGTDN